MRGWRRRSLRRLLVSLGEQTELIDTGRANLIDNGDHVAVLGASIAFDVNGLVKAGGEAIFNLPGEIGLECLCVAEIDVPIASDSHNDGIVFFGVLHFIGLVPW